MKNKGYFYWKSNKPIKFIRIFVGIDILLLLVSIYMSLISSRLTIFIGFLFSVTFLEVYFKLHKPYMNLMDDLNAENSELVKRLTSEGENMSNKKNRNLLLYLSLLKQNDFEDKEIMGFCRNNAIYHSTRNTNGLIWFLCMIGVLIGG